MAHLQVGKKTAELLEIDDFSDWDDQELLRGQKRNKNGTWTGRKPKVVPLKILHELNRRAASKGVANLTGTLEAAIKYICDVASGRTPPDKDRMHACEVIMNRVLGMTPQRVQLDAEVSNKYEEAGVRKAIVLRDFIDVDSTEEEDEEDPFN